jgi:hypothetical protein
LRKDPRVEALRLAEPYEGGEGVTLVQLKWLKKRLLNESATRLILLI